MELHGLGDALQWEGSVAGFATAPIIPGKITTHHNTFQSSHRTMTKTAFINMQEITAFPLPPPVLSLFHLTHSQTRVGGCPFLGAFSYRRVDQS